MTPILGSYHLNEKQTYAVMALKDGVVESVHTGTKTEGVLNALVGVLAYIIDCAQLETPEELESQMMRLAHRSGVYAQELSQQMVGEAVVADVAKVGWNLQETENAIQENQRDLARASVLFSAVRLREQGELNPFQDLPQETVDLLEISSRTLGHTVNSALWELLVEKPHYWPHLAKKLGGYTLQVQVVRCSSAD